MSTYKSGISVSIVTYNTWRRTSECISSALDCLQGDDFEILVFDNGEESLPDANWPHQVKIIKSDANIGFGSGHNANLARARYDTFIILNPDVTINESALRDLKSTIKEPGVAAAAPLLVYPNGTEQLSFRKFPTLRTEVGRVFGADRRPDTRWSTLVQIRKGQGRVAVEQPAAAVLAVRTSTLKQVNGFDTAYPMYFEDVDLCARLRALGDIVALSDCFAIHDGEGTAKSFRRATTFWIENSRRRYHRKFEQGTQLQVILAAIWVSGLSHAIATAASAAVSGGTRRQELLAKSQGYFTSLIAASYGSDEYWREKFLRK